MSEECAFDHGDDECLLVGFEVVVSEPTGLVAQEGAFDEGADAGAFVGVKLVECGEVESQALVLGAAFVGVEEEFVGGDGEGDGEGAVDVEVCWDCPGFG